MEQHEHREQVSIPGELSSSCGWARSSFFDYNPNFLGSRIRLIESDRYVVFNSQIAVFMEVLDGMHLKSIEIGTADLVGRSHISELLKLPFSFDSLHLPPDAEKGSIRIKNKNLILDFSAMPQSSRLLKIDYPLFGHGQGLRGVIVLSPPSEDAEALYTVNSWRKDKTAFRYTRKAPWYKAEGVIQFGDQELVFGAGNSWAVMDWNRGIQARTERRYWAASCGLCGTRQVSFNFGYGGVVSGPGTENAFFIDGQLHKLNQVTFRINPRDWMQHWHFTSDDKRVDLEFSPHLQHSAGYSSFFRKRKRRFFIGTYSGTVKTETGEVLEIEAFTGIAERSKLQL